MNEDFVTFELAKKLKEKGFRYDKNNLLDRLCKENQINHPFISQVLKWLREKNIILAINPSYFKGDYCFGWDCDIWVNANYSHRCVSDNSYEEAALAGIEYVIDNLI